MLRTPYEQIVNVSKIASIDATHEANVVALAEQESCTIASADVRRVLLLAIDIQNDFMEGTGTLPVVGSKGDVERLTRWMYLNLGKITTIMASLDSHMIAQIFHPAWWVDGDGNHPAPFTMISVDEVEAGKWRPLYGEYGLSLAYLQHLKCEGKKQLCIWPYHCLDGGYGANLEGQFLRMVQFHAAARRVSPIFVRKGQNPYSEMYGIVRAEYDPELRLTHEVLQAIEQHDAIYLAGEASSHCLLESCLQIVDVYRDRPEITSRLTILTDCTSPIGGFEQSTAIAFDELRNQYGVALARSTEQLSLL